MYLMVKSITEDLVTLFHTQSDSEIIYKSEEELVLNFKGSRNNQDTYLNLHFICYDDKMIVKYIKGFEAAGYLENILLYNIEDQWNDMIKVIKEYIWWLNG